MADPKNSVLADKLAGLKLDYDDYGPLPLRLDVLAFVPPDGKTTGPILAQFDKLIYIRNHLKKIDEYIKLTTKEPINEWDAKVKAGLSTKVLSKLKGHNNETGGISAYFHDLQKIYDDEESAYDRMECQCKITDGTKDSVDGMRGTRMEKRKTRVDERKILVKDLKKDGKGFLFIETPEAPAADDKKQEDKKEVVSADGGGKVEEKIKEEVEDIKKDTKKVGIYIAGFIISLTVVIAIASASGEKK